MHTLYLFTLWVAPIFSKNKLKCQLTHQITDIHVYLWYLTYLYVPIILLKIFVSYCLMSRSSLRKYVIFVCVLDTTCTPINYKVDKLGLFLTMTNCKWDRNYCKFKWYDIINRKRRLVLENLHILLFVKFM